MITNYDNFTLPELESMAEFQGNKLALAIAGKYQSEIESGDLADEIETLKAELRDYEIAPILAEIDSFVEWCDDYHKGDDYLSNYFYREHIADSISYDNQLSDTLRGKFDAITDDEIDHIIDQILNNMLGDEIRLSHMGTYQSDNEIAVCSFVLGELQEQLSDELLAKVKANNITDDEINNHIDGGYYSDESVYFDHSYDIASLYVSVEAIETCLNDYREENAE